MFLFSVLHLFIKLILFFCFLVVRTYTPFIPYMVRVPRCREKTFLNNNKMINNKSNGKGKKSEKKKNNKIEEQQQSNTLYHPTKWAAGKEKKARWRRCDIHPKSAKWNKKLPYGKKIAILFSWFCGAQLHRIPYICNIWNVA